MSLDWHKRTLDSLSLNKWMVSTWASERRRERRRIQMVASHSVCCWCNNHWRDIWHRWKADVQFQKKKLRRTKTKSTIVLNPAVSFEKKSVKKIEFTQLKINLSSWNLQILEKKQRKFQWCFLFFAANFSCWENLYRKQPKIEKRPPVKRFFHPFYFT